MASKSRGSWEWCWTPNHLASMCLEQRLELCTTRLTFAWQWGSKPGHCICEVNTLPIKSQFQPLTRIHFTWDFPKFLDVDLKVNVEMTQKTGHHKDNFELHELWDILDNGLMLTCVSLSQLGGRWIVTVLIFELLGSD